MKIFKTLRKSLTILIGLFVLLSSLVARAEGVNVTVGDALKYPNGYTYMTHYFYIDGKLAYCLQPKLGPTSNGTYEAREISSEGNDGYPLLIKVLACGYGGPNDLTTIYFPGATEQERYIYTHIAAGYAYMSNSEMNQTINDITGLTNEQFEACGLGDFVRAAWNTDYKGSVKLVHFDSYQDLGYLASYSTKPKNVKVEITKKDVNGGVLKGAEYGIYEDEACTVLIKTMNRTDDYGKTVAEFDKQDKYIYIKETAAPTGYKLDAKVYSLYIGSDQSLELTDDVVLGNISLQKYDSRGPGQFMGNATLEGSEYQIYTAEQIKNSHTGQIYHEKDVYIGTILTDSSGFGLITGLYPGQYYLKETKAPEGFMLSDEVLIANLVVNEGNTTVVETSVSASEEIIKGPVEINKTRKGDNKTKVEGAGFSIYLKSDLKVRDGKYDFENSEPVVIGINGEKLLYTNSSGYIKTVDLPYGTYILHETVVPKNYLVTEDVEFNINQKNVPGIAESINISDDFYKIKFRINKRDAAFKTPITLDSDKNAVFRIYDISKGKYIEENIKTGADGYAYSSVYLEAGRYRIEEMSAPEGYVLNSKPVEIQIDDSSKTVYDAKLKENVISINFNDDSIKGKLIINKTGEKLSAVTPGNKETGQNAVFIYKNQPLEGVTFGIYVKNDIFYPDGRKDSNGKRQVLYKKDDLIACITTDKNGDASYSDNSKPLYYGDYYIKELSCPEGYILDESVKEFSIKSSKDSVQHISVENVRKRNEVIVKKLDEDTKELLKGAYFEIYAGEDIVNEAGEIIVKCGDFLGVSNGDADGISKFNLDLTKSKYIVKEIISPKGYDLNDEEHVAVFEDNEKLQKLVSEVTVLDKKTPKKTTKKRKTVVKGASSKKIVNNYQTDDNGESGYSVIPEDENYLGKRMILGIGLLVIALIISVGIFRDVKKKKKK